MANNRYESALKQLKDAKIPPLSDEVWNRIEASIDQPRWVFLQRAWAPALVTCALMLSLGLGTRIQSNLIHTSVNQALNDLVYTDILQDDDIIEGGTI